jgi:hypothetical protein
MAARGRPFQSGQSGNPGGRPKGLQNLIRKKVGEDGEQLVDFVYGVLKDEDEKPALRFDAATWLADRGFGKPAVYLEHSGEGGGPIRLDLSALTDSELKRLEALVAKAEPK